jgi:hypothetical protein
MCCTRTRSSHAPWNHVAATHSDFPCKRRLPLPNGLYICGAYCHERSCMASSTSTSPMHATACHPMHTPAHAMHPHLCNMRCFPIGAEAVCRSQWSGTTGGLPPSDAEAADCPPSDLLALLLLLSLLENGHASFGSQDAVARAAARLPLSLLLNCACASGRGKRSRRCSAGSVA